MMNDGWVPNAEQMHQLDYDYLLNEHTWAMYRVGPAFQEPVDDNMPTDEDRRLLDSAIEAKSSKDDSDDNSDAGGMTPDVEEESY